LEEPHVGVPSFSRGTPIVIVSGMPLHRIFEGKKDRCRASQSGSPLRLALVVSHPIQYYVPLYQRLAQREDVVIKVFFTGHAGKAPAYDEGFGIPIQWDIPLTNGYDFELIGNISTRPGFWGFVNPGLIPRILDWQPDAVHVTGWAWASHLHALYELHRRRIPTLFRGDSHLLDGYGPALRWRVKKLVLSRVFDWVDGFLVTGKANRRYYQAFGVADRKLFACPHSVDVARFVGINSDYEDEAKRWRMELGFGPRDLIILFAGKFEPKKNPLELMKAVISVADEKVRLIMVGNGELQASVESLAAIAPDRIRVLNFQNQSKMPVVYRLGDLFVLPSLYGETWGLAVIEALASSRPVLVSSRVGCAEDVVTPECGHVYPSSQPDGLAKALNTLLARRENLSLLGKHASARARRFDIAVTAEATVGALKMVCGV
jgi:glycosyltransferase involved in cell wall biosynthesis